MLGGSVTVLGARFPTATILVAGLTLACSVLGAMLWRAGIPLLASGVLVPGQVLSGELWRLVTWVLFELDPLSLIFLMMVLLLFGRDLAQAWGPGRFLAVYLGITALAGGVTCLIGALLWPALLNQTYATAWPLGEAIIIAWALLFPARQMLVYFVLPMGGRNLVYLTVGGTVLFALMGGIGNFVPHFAAQGLMYAYLQGFSPRMLWLRLKARTARWQPPRRATHLRPVDKDEPPRWLH